MKNEFPNPCCRCGACCLKTPCPMALDRVKGAKIGNPCPALEFDEEKASCGLFLGFMDLPDSEFARSLARIGFPSKEFLLKETFGIGKGCCIKGFAVRRVQSLENGYWHGIPVEFASLPAEIKLDLARRQARRKGMA